MTEAAAAGHCSGVSAAAPEAREPELEPQTLEFADVYRDHFGFLWRSLRRLGVQESALDDAVQEVFLIVHRRLAEFEGRAPLRSWLFGIALRVASQHRRTLRRRPEDALPPELPATQTTGPDEDAARAQAVRRVYAALDELDDDKRAVFVLAELEQMTAPEIAAALSIKLNTVYSRLRAARQRFSEVFRP